MIQQTSLKSYEELKKGKEKSQLEIIYEIYKVCGDLYDRQISKIIRIEPSTISARRNKLIEMGLITKKGEKISEYTQKIVNIYGVFGEKGEKSGEKGIKYWKKGVKFDEKGVKSSTGNKGLMHIKKGEKREYASTGAHGEYGK